MPKDERMPGVEGFVVARVRGGAIETVGSIVSTRDEAEAKRAIATERLGAGPPWTVQPALLLLPELAP